jgi:hypothetical protein
MLYMLQDMCGCRVVAKQVPAAVVGRMRYSRAAFLVAAEEARRAFDVLSEMDGEPA